MSLSSCLALVVLVGAVLAAPNLPDHHSLVQLRNKLETESNTSWEDIGPQDAGHALCRIVAATSQASQGVSGVDYSVQSGISSEQGCKDACVADANCKAIEHDGASHCHLWSTLPSYTERSEATLFCVRLSRTATGTAIFGDNHFGQLGLGDIESQDTPQNFPSPNTFTEFAAGQYHSLVLNSGAVFSFGTNLNGQLGHGDFGSHPVPEEIVLSKTIVHIAAGGAHSVLVASDGTVYTFGRNTFGQLCNGDVGGSHPTPTLVEGLADVASAAAGWGHTVFLTNGGEVKACGRNTDGELGVGNTLPHYTPQAVSTLASVTRIACGAKHTLAATASKVYAFGSNSHGQLCQSVVSASSPVVVETHSKTPLGLAAGLYHSVVLLDNAGNGEAHVCGFNKFFQLGLDKGDDASTQQDENELTRVGLISDSIKQVAAGAYHTVFLTNTDKVYTTGRNYDGQLGRATETHNGKTPAEVTLSFTPTAIAAGGGVTVVQA